MFEVPDSLNLTALVGKHLEQICLGYADLQFRFEGGERISGSGKVLAEVKGEETEVFGEQLWNDSGPLSPIVGSQVIEWKKESLPSCARPRAADRGAPRGRRWISGRARKMQGSGGWAQYS